MGFFELLLLSIGLSMDALAVAVCTGLTIKTLNLKKMLIVGLYLGIFQGIMPVIGYLVATLFADRIIAYDHWIAFAMLAFLGGRMIKGSFDRDGCADRECGEGSCDDRECPGGGRPNTGEVSLGFAQMIPLALATSIDALAVGVSFAFLKVNIIYAATFIGVTTLILSMAGVKIGNVFGMKFKSKAELAGGIILIMIGVKILLEHLGFI